MKTKSQFSLSIIVILMMSALLFTCQNDSNTPKSDLIGKWMITNAVIEGRTPLNEIDWSGSLVEINEIGDNYLLFEVSDSPNDTIWSLSSQWKKLSESETLSILETDGTTFRETFKKDGLFSGEDLILRISKHSANSITIQRYISIEWDDPTFLLPCCAMKFNLTKQVSK